jgi:hypothetical protein
MARDLAIGALAALMLACGVPSAGAADRFERGAVLDVPAFTERERRVITDYFARAGDALRRGSPSPDGRRPGPAGHSSRGGAPGLPPGLARREQLPPGLQHRLERDGRLPAGLHKQALPEELRARLPRRSGRYQRALGDGRVLLIDRVTDRIVDILEGVRGWR